MKDIKELFLSVLITANHRSKSSQIIEKNWWNYHCCIDRCHHYMFTISLLHGHYMFTIYSLYVHYMFTIYLLHVRYIFTICSLYIHTFVFELFFRVSSFARVSLLGAAMYYLFHFLFDKKKCDLCWILLVYTLFHQNSRLKNDIALATFYATGDKR